MRSTINGITYDTSAAELIAARSNNQVQPRNRSKELFRTAQGLWFLCHKGGPSTDLGFVNSRGDLKGRWVIEPIGDENARAFLEAEGALDALAEYFGVKPF